MVTGGVSDFGPRLASGLPVEKREKTPGGPPNRSSVSPMEKC